MSWPGHPEEPFFAVLAARRPYARLRVWRRAAVGDVIHAPSGPLEVLVAPRADPGSAHLVAVVLDRYGNGDSFERELAHPPMRDVLVSRPADVPERLQ